ncbi:unnamed protein product [Leptosia nina]|uniref:Uncharacterized protein n=1 Tax=Leptosia nina TaxID=320188 RepID=A0AAV1IV78_9NEOP
MSIVDGLSYEKSRSSTGLVDVWRRIPRAVPGRALSVTNGVYRPSNHEIAPNSTLRIYDLQSYLTMYF